MRTWGIGGHVSCMADGIYLWYYQMDENRPKSKKSGYAFTDTSTYHLGVTLPFDKNYL